MLRCYQRKTRLVAEERAENRKAQISQSENLKNEVENLLKYDALKFNGESKRGGVPCTIPVRGWRQY